MEWEDSPEAEYEREKDEKEHYDEAKADEYIKSLPESFHTTARLVIGREAGVLASDIWNDEELEAKDYAIVGQEYKRITPDASEWTDWEAASAWCREFAKALLRNP